VSTLVRSLQPTGTMRPPGNAANGNDTTPGGTWTIPFGGGVGRVTRLGYQPVNMSVNFYGNAALSRCNSPTPPASSEMIAVRIAELTSGGGDLNFPFSILRRRDRQAEGHAAAAKIRNGQIQRDTTLLT